MSIKVDMSLDCRVSLSDADCENEEGDRRIGIRTSD